MSAQLERHLFSSKVELTSYYPTLFELSGLVVRYVLQPGRFVVAWGSNDKKSGTLGLVVSSGQHFAYVLWSTLERRHHT